MLFGTRPKPVVGNSRLPPFFRWRDEWIYLLGFGLLAALVAGLTWYAIGREYQNAMAYWETRQSGVADDRARLVSNWLSERQADAELLSSLPAIRALLSHAHGKKDRARLRPGEQPEVQTLLQRFAAAHGQVGIFLLDSDGQVVADTPGAQPLAPDVQELVRRVVRARSFRIELLGESVTRSTLAFISPLHGEGQSPGARRPQPNAPGAMVLLSDPNRTLFPLLIQESVPTQTGETFLVRRNGNEAVFISPLRHARPSGWLRAPLTASTLAGRAALEGREAFGTFTDYRGVRVLAATRLIALTGWGLVRKIDRDEALKDFRRRAWLEGLVAALFLFASAGLGLAHRRSAVVRAMKGEQEKFRGLLESAPDAMVISDPQGRIVLVNEQAEKMFGYRREELVGQPVETLVPQRLRTRRGENDKPGYFSMDSSEPPGTGFEMWGLRKDGSEFPVDATLSPIQTPSAVLVCSAIRDISDRKRAEAELRRVNRALTTLSECNEAIVHTTGETRLLQEICETIVRKGGYRLAWVGLAEEDEAKTVRPVAQAGFEEGYLETVKITWAETERGHGPVGTAIRRGWPCLVRDVMTDPAFAPWRDEAAQRGYASVIALPLEKDSKPFGALAIYSAEPDGFDAEELRLLSELASNLAYGVATLRARGERGRLEQQLLQAQKMEAVGRLAGGVAHDFNNLLTVMTGYSQFLLDKLPAEGSLHHYAEEIKRAGERAAALTRQLLAFSRRQVLAPCVLNLNDVVSDMGKLLHRLIGEDIDLVASLAPDLGPVKADPGQIEQVIMNLAVNARDAMPQGGKLTIETANVELDDTYARTHLEAVPGSYVVLAVSDTGRGMDAETQSRIFEPFFTTKEEGKGTGLGLATVYGIVKQSGGNISVYSEVGQGTTFKIYLPRVGAPVEKLDAQKLALPALRGSETILVAEDQPAVRSLVRSVLDSFGYRVLEARNGEDALVVADQLKGPIHLLLTDVVMPDMSGRDLAEHLGPFHREMKVLYMSGYTDDAVVRHGVLEPGIAFIQKPFSPDSLAGKVRETLDRKP